MSAWVTTEIQHTRELCPTSSFQYYRMALFYCSSFIYALPSPKSGYIQKLSKFQNQTTQPASLCSKRKWRYKHTNKWECPSQNWCIQIKLRTSYWWKLTGPISQFKILSLNKWTWTSLTKICRISTMHLKLHHIICISIRKYHTKHIQPDLTTHK